MKIALNGRVHELSDGTSVDQLIADVAGGTTRGSAVVIDGEVVPRSTWPSVSLRDGQTIELITAVQGG